MPYYKFRDRFIFYQKRKAPRCSWTLFLFETLFYDYLLSNILFKFTVFSGKSFILDFHHFFV